jgi:copper(I)-binding protein
MPSRLHRLTPCLALATALALTGCGGGDPKPGPEVAGGNAGVDERVNAHVKVLDVELEYPLDGQYDVGEDARLYLAISNDGNTSDALVDVTGPDFADARVSGAGLPLEVPAGDTVFVGAEAAPVITLTDLDRALRSSESIPVTFRFERAGVVTVQAMVAAEGQTPSPSYDFPTTTDDA